MFNLSETKLAPFSQDAVEALMPFAPLVEIGAADGSWCWELHKAGVDCIGFDVLPTGQGVEQGNHHVAAGVAGDRTLLAVWPPSVQELTRWMEAADWPRVVVVANKSRFMYDQPGYVITDQRPMPAGKKGTNHMWVYEREPAKV